VVGRFGARWLTPGALALALAVATAGGALAQPAPAAYRAIDLGMLPGDTTSVANNINNLGQIVGVSSSPNTSHAVIWEHGKIRSLDPLPGGHNTAAQAINNEEVIVGSADTRTGQTHAVEWRENKVIDLGTLAGDVSSIALDINDRNEVVGNSFDATGTTHAVIWRNGRISDLGLPPDGKFIEATDINNRGQVVGPVTFTTRPSLASSFFRFFLWDPRTGMHDLGDAGAGPFALRSDSALINDRGEIAASWIDPTKTPVTGLLGTWSGRIDAFAASDINNRGQIVGGYIPAGGQHFTETPAVWQQTTGLQLLPLLQGAPNVAVTGSAEAVSERQTIVGQSLAADGQGHAVKWLPVRN
jgi:probable HAF family extracellular repeat protein